MAYKHTNSKGITYYLHKSEVTLRGGKKLLESVYSADEKIKASDIDDVEITVATELEFWVKTPEDTADRNQLSNKRTGACRRNLLWCRV